MRVRPTSALWIERKVKETHSDDAAMSMDPIRRATRRACARTSSTPMCPTDFPGPFFLSRRRSRPLQKRSFFYRCYYLHRPVQDISRCRRRPVDQSHLQRRSVEPSLSHPALMQIQLTCSRIRRHTVSHRLPAPLGAINPPRLAMPPKRVWPVAVAASGSSSSWGCSRS